MVRVCYVVRQAIHNELICKMRSAVLAAAKNRSNSFFKSPTLEHLVNEASHSSSQMARKEQVFRRLFANKRKKRHSFKNNRLLSLPQDLSPVNIDPQLLHAIDETRTNIWMTDVKYRELFESQVRQVLGHALTCGSLNVHCPVLLSDHPIIRLPFGHPKGFRCTASQIGANLEEACSIFLPLDPCTSSFGKLFVSDDSRRWGTSLCSQSKILEGHIEFPGVDLCRIYAVNLELGDLLVMGPDVFFGRGPNLSFANSVGMLYNIVDRQAAIRSAKSCWTWKWRRRPCTVPFSNSTFFPPLF